MNLEVVERDLESFLREQYSKLFALPRDLFLALLFILINIFIMVFSYLQNPGTGVFLTYSLAATLYLFMLVLFFNNIENISMGLKRILGIAVFSLAPYAFVSWILYVLDRPIYTIYSASSAMIFLIRYIFWGDMISSVLVSLFIGFSASLVASGSVSLLTALEIFKISVISTSIMLIFIIFIEIIGRLSGVRAFDLGRGFIRSWMFDDNKYLEEVLSRDSEKRDIVIKSLVFDRDRERVILLYPGFHFGPFRKVGSSDAVYVFDRALGDLGSVLVFHTTGTHERNIVKRDIVERIAREYRERLENIIRSRDSLEDKISVDYQASEEGWSVYRFGGDKCVSLMIYNTNGSDDLDEHLESEIERLYGDRLVVGLVDAHSVYGRRNYDTYNLVKLLRSSIEKHSRDARSSFRIGFGVSRVKNLCGGLCSDLVKSLVIEVDGERDLIVYIYGNNMIKSAHERIVSEMRSKGFRNVVIVTPDDHSCAAVSIGDPYVAVRLCSDLLEAVRESVKRALEDLGEARLLCDKTVFREIPVMGSAVWSYIRGLERLGPITPRLWTIFLIASIIPLFLF
ncbi:MAG: DUF2070 family protein [Sulfolobales archaeon]